MSKDVFKSIAEIERAEKIKEKKAAKRVSSKKKASEKNSSKKEKAGKPDKQKGRKVEASEIIELLKNTLIMLLITVFAGGILAFVYENTKAPIAEMEIKTRQNACRRVFYEAASFSESKIAEYPVTEEFKTAHTGSGITDCVEAYDEAGSLKGYVVEVTSHEGYGGDIVFYVGIGDDGTVNGVSFIEISETAGLGMRAPEVLAPQFRGRKAEVFEVVKSGAADETQIDAISSATITSKAVTGGVNTALAYFREILKGGVGNE